MERVTESVVRKWHWPLEKSPLWEGNVSSHICCLRYVAHLYLLAATKIHSNFIYIQLTRRSSVLRQYASNLEAGKPLTDGERNYALSLVYFADTDEARELVPDIQTRLLETTKQLNLF